MIGTLEGRGAVITGGTRGLGLELARAFLHAGATVLITGRDELRLREAADELRQVSRLVHTQCGNIGDPAHAEQLARCAREALGDVQILVNNAGIYGPMGLLEDNDPDAWMDAVRINLLGPMLACRVFLPHFRAQRYGKIIQLSGGGATAPMARFTAYAASKAAVVRFAESLAEETLGTGIDVNCIAPGALNTRLLEDVLAAGPSLVGESFFQRAVTQKERGGASFERAAALAVFLASAASDGITGRLLSAVWDPWEDLASHREELAGSDIYTLRRILARDRGLDWGEK